VSILDDESLLAVFAYIDLNPVAAGIALVPETSEYTGRLFRAGKSALSAELAGIFDRLGTTGESWRIRLEKLRTGRLFGRFFASSRDTLKKVAGRLGMRSAWNLGGCPVR
jgi:hypothetical protein